MADNEVLKRVLAIADDTAETENAVLLPLLDEIDLIQDPLIMSFVRIMLINAPAAFWIIPSTLVAENERPPDELLLGGNVLHTKRVARVAHMMADAQGITGDDLDIIVAAAILHDLTKGGIDEENVQYDDMHPYTVERWVEGVRRKEFSSSSEDQSSSLWTDEKDIHRIMRLIRCSEGPWSPIIETVPLTSHEWILHFANLVAANLHRIVDPGAPVQHWRWILPPPAIDKSNNIDIIED